MSNMILIRGGGDLASGVALRLFRVGMKCLITEIAQPLAVRRTVAFAEAVYAGEVKIEEVSGRRVETLEEALTCVKNGLVPVMVDPEVEIKQALQPLVAVDGRMTKRPPEYGLNFAPLIVGLGPGFDAGVNCHAVVETMRGPFLGHVYWQGGAEQDTGLPERVGSYQTERVLRSPADGVFSGQVKIGAIVKKGEIVAQVDGRPVIAHFDGLVRGLLHDGVKVRKDVKVGDLDPRLDPRIGQTVSDKALAVGGGVLEAILTRPAIRSQLW
jgi:xanthine dehydrogenase accessory factor